MVNDHRMNGSHSRGNFSNSYRGDGGFKSRSSSHYESRGPTYNRRHPDRENPPTSRCIGVFGLSLRTREKDLYELFSRYGDIDDVNIINDNKTGRSRGFGFVYYDNMNSAVMAKERAHGIEIDGHTVRTEFSVTGGPHAPTPGVYLGKPTRPSFDDRRPGFRDYRGPPPPRYDRRPPPRGRSPPPRAPRFRSSRSRSPLSSRRRHVADRTNPPSSRCIGVFGMSTRTRERDLYDVFSRYGVIDNVNLVFDNQTGRSRGFAFIYYTNDKDAAEAKERAHGIEIDGREIRCEFSVTQRPHSPTPGVYLGKPTRQRSRSPQMFNRSRARHSRSRSRSFERRY